MQRQREEMQRMREVAAQVTDADMPAVEDLWYAEERTALPEWLRDRGWQASSVDFAGLMARYGRNVADGADVAMPPTLFVSAQRPK